MSKVVLDRRSLLAIFAGSSAFGLANGFATNLTLGSSGPSGTGNIQLQAIGALGVGHIQSTLGMIGVIADSVSRQIYTQKQVEDLMKGTINGLESPKKMLRKLQETNISPEDAEFLDRMIGVFNALQKEATSLIGYSKTLKTEDAQRFERERRIVLRKLADLTHQDTGIDLNSATGFPNVTPD